MTLLAVLAALIIMALLAVQAIRNLRRPENLPFFDPNGQIPVILDLSETLNVLDGPIIKTEKLSGIQDIVEVPLRQGGPPEKVMLIIQLYLERITFGGAKWKCSLSPSGSLDAVNAVFRTLGQRGSDERETQKAVVANLIHLGETHIGARLIVWVGLLPNGETISGYFVSSGATLPMARKAIAVYNQQMAELNPFRMIFNSLSHWFGQDWCPVPMATLPEEDPWDTEEAHDILGQMVVPRMYALVSGFFNRWITADQRLRQGLHNLKVPIPRTGMTYVPVTPPTIPQGQNLKDLRTEVFAPEEPSAE